MKWLKMILNRGISVSYSTGKPFDPSSQKRTDAVKDIINAERRKMIVKKPRFEMEIEAGDYGIVTVKHMIDGQRVKDRYLIDTDTLGRVTTTREVRNYG